MLESKFHNIERFPVYDHGKRLFVEQWTWMSLGWVEHCKVFLQTDTHYSVIVVQ